MLQSVETDYSYHVSVAYLKPSDNLFLSYLIYYVSTRNFLVAFALIFVFHLINLKWMEI